MPAIPSPHLPPSNKHERFLTTRSTLLVDRLMTWFIVCGGLSVIAAVFGIFIFIFNEILPLFSSAKVHETAVIQMPEADYLAMGFDEWGDLPFTVDSTGKVRFINVAAETVSEPISLLNEGEGALTSIAYNHPGQTVIVGTDQGHLNVVHVTYSALRNDNDTREVSGAIEPVLSVDIGVPGNPLRAVDYADSGERKLAAGIQDQAGVPHVVVATLVQTRSLMGASKITPGIQADLTDQITGVPERVLVNTAGNSVIVATTAGEIFYFYLETDGFVLRQQFTPFPQGKLATIDWLLGDVSLVCTDATGANTVWSLYIQNDLRLFGQTKELTPLPTGGTWYAHSIRNKAFLLGAGSIMSLRYATTETIRWQGDIGFAATLGAMNGKYSRMAALDDSDKLHVYNFNDPHPEAGVRSFFGKLWYEGFSEPKYAWQSTGGTDDFEPKLSLVPLIIGSLKGTFYALLFAVPIAILAAVYTAEFMRPNFKRVVKPTLELMASLPSVVLGFLAALWLAPKIEDQVPTIFCGVILVPTLAILFGLFWSRLPARTQALIPRGWEFLALFPILFFAVGSALILGPGLEWLVCRVPIVDTATGEVTKVIHDFRLWWPYVTGTPFEQRNSLVVGFIMGFAVIPIIYTISEDSLSSVPPTLRSGSLALGASRWQTAIHIVLPTAAAGIFSAVMIGFGRAVGETMIVVMATGNTAVMNFNIFTGMRTLSANIAVELPEAPHLSTLYRTLFLGAMVLFLLTFVVNTIAELMRQYLRERYKTV